MNRLLTRLAGLILSHHRTSSDRERIRAKARQMRKDMGLPPLKALGR